MSAVADIAGRDRRDLKIEKLGSELEILRGELSEAIDVAVKLSAVFERCPDAIFIKDLSGEYILANPATAAFLDVDVELLIGSNDEALFGSDAAEEIRDVDQFVVASSTPFRYQARRNYHGQERVIQTTKWPWLRDGAPAGVIGVARDVTRASLDDEARHLQGSVARALLLSPSMESAMKELPEAIRESFDAEAVIRWRVEGTEMVCSGFSVHNPDFAGPFIDECRRGTRPLEEFPQMLLELGSPQVVNVDDQGWDSERSILMERLDLRTALGFAVSGPGRTEIFEVFIAERRTAVPALLENLEAARALIEGALSRDQA